jgi:hypothetical protein
MLPGLPLNAQSPRSVLRQGVQAGKLLQSHGAVEPHPSTSKSSCTWACCGYGNVRIGGALPGGIRARLTPMVHRNTVPACHTLLAAKISTNQQLQRNLPGEKPVCVPVHQVSIPTSMLSAVGPAMPCRAMPCHAVPCLPAPGLQKPGEPVACRALRHVCCWWLGG